MAAFTPKITPRSYPPHSPPLYMSPDYLNPLLDLTYLKKYLPETITDHRLAQGQLLRKFSILKNYLESTCFPTVYMCCRASEGILFKWGLKNHPRIEKIEVSENYLTIELNSSSESSVQRFYSDPSENESKKQVIQSMVSAGSSFPGCIPNWKDQKLTGYTSDPFHLTPRSSNFKDAISRSPTDSQNSKQSLESPRSPRGSNFKNIIPKLPMASRSSKHSIESPRTPYDPAMNGEILLNRLQTASQGGSSASFLRRPPIDLTQIVSSSIRFSVLKTDHYLGTLQKILQYLTDGLLSEQTFLDITLYNIDSLFFIHLLNRLCSEYTEEITLKPNYTIHLKLKRDLDLKEVIHQIGSQKKGLHEEWALFYLKPDVSSSRPRSIQALSFAFLDTCSLFLECSSSPRDAFFSGSKALARFKTPIEHPKTAPFKEEEGHKNRSIRVKLHSEESKSSSPREESSEHSKLLVRTKSQSEQSKVCSPKSDTSDHKSFFRTLIHLKSHEEEKALSSSENLKQKARGQAVSYLSYRLQYEPINNDCEEELWQQLWQDVDLYLPSSPLYRDIKQKEEIKKLVHLKCSVETASFAPLEAKLPEEIQRADVYQLLRGFFPKDNDIPIYSVWINRRPLGMDLVMIEPEKPVFIYFQNFIYSLLQHRSMGEIDIPSFVKRLLATEENEEFLPETDTEAELLLILKSSIFVPASKGFFTLKKIEEKLPADYKIISTKSQTLGCEFFLTKEGDFKIIHTSSYTLEKLREAQGELVLKSIIARVGGQWSCQIKIPVIDLDFSLKPKVQEEIYKVFQEEAKRD